MRSMLERLRIGGLSLRLRLLAGAGIIAVLAMTAAGLAAWASARSAALIREAAGAQTRVELLAQLSARVSDYALVAIEGAASNLPVGERRQRLETRADAVRASFRAIGDSLAEAVEAAEELPITEGTRRAARSVALARMAANFEALAQKVPVAGDPVELRARLNTFATMFAPLLAQAIEVERRAVQRAQEEAERQRVLTRNVALGIALLAAGLFAVFQFGLIRPLLARLDQLAGAAAAVGRGAFSAVPPVDRRDELGLVFAQVARMAGRLARRRSAVDRDRARLEEIVADRTAALQAANARLEGIDAERRRLFADIGHELRTPLTVILAETELASGQGESDTVELREALSVIRARARRLNRRIDDILRVSRSETGQIDLEDAEFELAAAVRDAVDDVSPLARRARVRIATELGAERVRGDRDWSRQVIAGVLENAIRHSPEAAAVAVALRRADGKIAAEIIDEGDGVPEADQARVFERGVRSGRRGLGFGVGLSLAAWVMERQGGTISLVSPVQSDRERPGTRVTLTWSGA